MYLDLPCYDYATMNGEQKDGVVDVPLRKRSTPYEFVVKMSRDGETIELYNGKSHNAARVAYWQAVNTIRFLHSSGKVEMPITESHQLVGGFATVLETGEVISLHEPSGRCVEWAKRGWTGGSIAEKILSVIPGTLGLPRV
jgi:hypothetical protein